MVILERNIRLLVQSVASESGNAMLQPETKTKVSDIAIIIFTIILFAIFVMALASVCFRWSSHQLHSLDLSVNWSTDSNRTVSTAARGIEAAIVNLFPTFLYSEVKERRIGKGGVECAVCICEFEEEETLRLMPNCCHVFHAECVDAWLYNHTTCPLCRMELVFQPGEGSDPEPDPDSTNGHLLDGVTWTNTNRPFRSESTRLSRCRVSFSEILFSRSHSTGHCSIKPVENHDRFTLRLPEDVRRQLMKKIALTQVRSSRRGYRSRSIGSESSVFSHQPNNRRLHSKTFSFSDFVCSSNACGGDAVAPSRSFDSGEQFKRLKLDDRVCKYSSFLAFC